MFTAADLNFTHELIFSGEPEAMAKLYSPEFGDTSWQLFSSKMNSFVDENVFSANGWRFFQSSDDVYPFQMVTVFSSENNVELRKWRMMVRDMNEKYNVYLVSDSTGETLDRIFLSLQSQFKNFKYEKKEFFFLIKKCKGKHSVQFL